MFGGVRVAHLCSFFFVLFYYVSLHSKVLCCDVRYDFHILCCVFCPGWIIFIWKSNKILIKILLTVSCVVVVFFNAKIYVFVLYKMTFHFFNIWFRTSSKGGNSSLQPVKFKKADDKLIIGAGLNYLPFELFSPGQFQWLLTTMEVVKLQHSAKSSLWRSDDGLIPE